MNRKFVNMIVNDYQSRVYSVRRISLKQHLFHPSTEDAQKAAATAQAAGASKKGWRSRISSFKHLPKPNIKFSMPAKGAELTTMHFFSLLKGQGEGSVMFVGPFYSTVMYDLDLESVFPMPQAYFCKPSGSISLSMTRRSSGQDEQQLYIMGNGDEEDGRFEVLNYSRTGFPENLCVDMEQWWNWKPLPSPPIPPPDTGIDRKACPPSSAAVVDDTTICVSSVDAGAFAFDTVKTEWRRAGSWALPFHGGAEHVPELGLWFGLAAIDSPDHSLRAFDLSSSSWPPVVQQDWSYLDPLPDEWVLRQRHLVNLGSGKFCIATSFENVESHAAAYSSAHGLDDYLVINDLTVLTGVELLRGDDGLQMIKHKSKRYTSQDTPFHCLL